MTLSSKPLAALVVAILFGGIFFSSAMGWWQTESTKEAARFTSGEFAGQADPADIRGSYTLGDVQKNFGIPAGVLAEAFGVPSADPAAYQVKGLEEMYAEAEEEVGTASVRLFVALYTGRPFDLSTDIYLPESAAALLRSRNLTPEQAAYLEAHVLAGLGAEPAAVEFVLTPEVVTQPQPTAEVIVTPAVETQTQPSPPASIEAVHGPSSDMMVKGKTTFAELLEWGLSKETIEGVLGLPMPPAPGMTVKDYCVQNELGFDTIKPALQSKIDTGK